LLSDEEYAKQKTELMKEKARLEEILNDTGGEVNQWLDMVERTFDFACYARYWFKNGTPEEKSQILRALGSNLILKNKRLEIELKKSFTLIGQVADRVPQARAPFEPRKSGKNELKLEESYSKNPVVCPKLNEVRTWIMTSQEAINIPQFEKTLSKAS
jgi:hypothetical protein